MLLDYLKSTVEEIVGYLKIPSDTTRLEAMDQHLNKDEKANVLNHIFNSLTYLRGQLTFPVVSILVTDFVEEFDMSFIHQNDKTTVILLLSERCPSLKKLSLSAESNLAPLMVEELPIFDHLEILVTDKYFLTDTSLAKLAASYSHLKKIFTRFDGVSVEGLESLSKFKQLTHLAICKTPLKDSIEADSEFMATVIWFTPGLEYLCLCNALRFTRMLNWFAVKFGCERKLKLAKIEIHKNMPSRINLPHVEELVAEYPPNLKQFEAIGCLKKCSLITAYPMELRKFLWMSGHRLTHLELIHHHEIYFGSLPLEVFKCACPYLLHLKIEGRWTFDDPKPAVVGFQSLKECIIKVGMDVFPFGFLAAILKLKSLERLEYLGNNNGFSFPKAVNRATRMKDTINLKHLKLESFNPSNQNDTKGLKRLLQFSPNLTSMEIFTRNPQQTFNLNVFLINNFKKEGLKIQVHPTREEMELLKTIEAQTRFKVKEEPLE